MFWARVSARLSTRVRARFRVRSGSDRLRIKVSGRVVRVNARVRVR